jgi:hypothetical protein
MRTAQEVYKKALEDYTEACAKVAQKYEGTMHKGILVKGAVARAILRVVETLPGAWDWRDKHLAVHMAAVGLTRFANMLEDFEPVLAGLIHETLDEIDRMAEWIEEEGK